MPAANSNPYVNSAGAAIAESRGFQTIDLWSDPQDTTASFLLQADNCSNISGRLYVRPGLVGRFGGSMSSSSNAAPTGSSSSGYFDVGETYWGIPPAASYDLTNFEDADGYAWMIFTSGGKIYKTQQGSSNYTELLDVAGASFSLNSAACDCAPMGDFFYVCDGAHPTIRLDLNGGYPAYAIIAPADAPTATLSSLTVDTPDAADFSTGPMPSSGASLIANGAFDTVGAVSGNVYLPGAPWALVNGVYSLSTNSPDYGEYSASSGHSLETWPGHNFSLLLDNPGDAVGQNITPVANTTVSWVNPSPLADNACFLFQCQGRLQDNGSLAALAVTMTPFDSSGGALLSPQTQLLYPASGNGWTGLTALFNFTQQLTTDPDHYQFILSSGPNNVAGNGVWVAVATLTPFNDGPFLSDTGTGQIKWTAPYSEIGGSYMVRDYTVTGKDFSSVGILGFACTSGIPLTDLYIRFGFVEVGGSTIEWSNNVTFNATGTFGYVDITTIDTAVLASVRYLYIQAVLDLAPGDVAPGSTPNILTFGPLSAAGQLSVGLANYQYYVTETAVIDPFNSIESNPSPPAGYITPTDAQAEATIVIPADCPMNTATTEYNLYRLGGVWDDVRLIATVQKGTSVAYGADPTNPYYSWDHTTGTFVDNTPDIFLALADLMSFSKDPMPANAQALAAWEGRLCSAVGNVLNLSWLYNSDNSAALMTTLVLNTSDPNYPIEGASFPISSDPTDTIVRLIPFGTPVAAGEQFGGGLLVLNKRSVYLVQGTDASNFSVQQYDYGVGIGLVAFRGVGRVSSQDFVFMGPDRLHQFPPTLDSPLKDMGLYIQPQLYPAYPAQQTLQNATAFSTAWMVFHDAALYLGVPTPGDTANTVIWKYDYRVGGWTRWVGMAMTSARSMPPNSNGAQLELYLFGINGNLNIMQGTTDIATPISSPVGITFTIMVHGLRPGFFYRMKLRPLYYRWARLEWLQIEATMQGTLTVNAAAYEPGPNGYAPITGASSTQTYGLNGGGRGFALNMPSGLIEGEVIYVTVSGTVTEQAWIRGIRGYVTQTSQEVG